MPGEGRTAGEWRAGRRIAGAGHTPAPAAPAAAPGAALGGRHAFEIARMRVLRARPLGAGREVGRSAVLVTLGDESRQFTILFDCGMHMGYTDSRRFPDFGSIAPGGGSLTAALDAVVVTHFHLDHCGALPVLAGAAGYEGPIFMCGGGGRGGGRRRGRAPGAAGSRPALDLPGRTPRAPCCPSCSTTFTRC